MVSSCTQVTSTALLFRAVLFYLISPAPYPFTFFPFSSVSRSFFSNSPYPPIIFLPPPLMVQGSILSPHTPYIIYIIYILLLSILSPSTKILFIPISLLSSLILFRCWYEDRIVYPFISLHFLLPSFSVLFDVRIDRYFYVLLLSSLFFLFGALFSGMRIIRIYIHSSTPPILFDSVLLLM